MKTSIHIPKPCNEDWDAMVSEAGGRSCAKCQHTVADLTRASDDELIALFSSEAAPHCARFDPAQLDRALRPERRRIGAVPIAAFTSLLALALGTETLAQDPPTRLKGEVSIHPSPAVVDTPRTDILYMLGDTVMRTIPPDTTSLAPKKPTPPPIMGKFVQPEPKR